MYPFVRQYPGLVIFTISYLLAAVAGCVLTANGEFVFYLITLAILVGVVIVVHQRIHLTDGVLWSLSIWGALHMAGGLLPIPTNWPINGSQHVLYNLWLIPERFKYDHFVHAFGFGTCTWLCWLGLAGMLANAAGTSRSLVQPRFGRLTLCALAACGLGATNEIVEFAATVMVPETNVGGYLNTSLDIVANMMGSIAGAVLIWVTWRRGNR